eukprot:NODE_326_length_10940_cov_0.392122.p4 type:complete len:236 gc:universal NODE_326_length_10940_cov_0.392122:9155-9862(+)
MKKRKSINPLLKPVLDELKKVTSPLDYIGFVYKHFVVLMYEYGHCDYRQWRFRRYGMKKRHLSVVIQHLQERVYKTEDVFYPSSVVEDQIEADDLFRKNAKTRKKTLKKQNRVNKKVLIYWGNGDFSHTFSGNPTSSSHQAREMLMNYNGGIELVMTNETNTSKTCMICEHDYTIEPIPFGRYRLRVCTNCSRANRACYTEKDVGSSKYIRKRGIEKYYEDTRRRIPDDWLGSFS